MLLTSYKNLTLKRRNKKYLTNVSRITTIFEEKSLFFQVETVHDETLPLCMISPESFPISKCGMPAKTKSSGEKKSGKQISLNAENLKEK